MAMVTLPKTSMSAKDGVVAVLSFASDTKNVASRALGENKPQSGISVLSLQFPLPYRPDGSLCKVPGRFCSHDVPGGGGKGSVPRAAGARVGTAAARFFGRGM